MYLAAAPRDSRHKQLAFQARKTPCFQPLAYAFIPKQSPTLLMYLAAAPRDSRHKQLAFQAQKIMRFQPLSYASVSKQSSKLLMGDLYMKGINDYLKSKDDIESIIDGVSSGL